MKEPALVHLAGLLSNFPKPLARLVSELGDQPKFGSSASRKKMVNKVSSSLSVGRIYKPNRKLTPDELQRLVAQYEGGTSIADLARQFDMHTQTVDAHLKRQGVRKRGAFKLSPKQVAKAVELYADGWSTVAIAKEFDVATNTVARGLVRAGVKVRKSSRPGRTSRNDDC
ncbi:hypothetical protein [Nocardia nova]|uniref:hypothetical protein n=1 Tax=Nocardia nova TaxID=37330 RepID=UPI0027398CB2|nr:hypothetical protein [Nocardia nova]